MIARSFIVTVETGHDEEYLDYFAKHLAYRLAGSAFRVTDVEPVNALNTQYRAGWRAAIKSVAQETRQTSKRSGKKLVAGLDTATSTL